MFKNSESEISIKDAETIIGPSIKVKGNFHGQGNIIIEGLVEGSIKTEKSLLIGNKAKITATIAAHDAKVGGIVTGNIKVVGYLEILSSAKIFGDVEAAKISVEKGAVLNGRCSMLPMEKENDSEIKKH
ncbi:MAG: polymer-forming cytoskeletal protein [bacterium]